jgi:SAM-dependent methyltransferase
MGTEEEWEHLLGIRTGGRDDSHFDGAHHPYEPTDYCVLERLASFGYIGKKNVLLDYGSGKGRVCFFMAHETGCRAVGVECDERLWKKSMENRETFSRKQKISFVHQEAALFRVPDDVDTCFFFNPFDLSIWQEVFQNLKASWNRKNREIRLFLYFPEEDTEKYLKNMDNIRQEAEIDCGDLFPIEDTREKILILSMGRNKNARN